MPIDETDSLERERLLDNILTTYLQEVDAGQSPNRQEWLNRYPHLASELAEFFADQDKIASWTEPIRAAAEYPSTQVPTTDSLPYSSYTDKKDPLDACLEAVSRKHSDRPGFYWAYCVYLGYLGLVGRAWP